MIGISSGLIDALIQVRREERIGNPIPQSAEELQNSLKQLNPQAARELNGEDAQLLLEKSGEIAQQREAREVKALLELDALDRQKAQVNEALQALALDIYQQRRPYTRAEIETRERLIDLKEQANAQQQKLLRSDADAFYSYHARTISNYLSQLDHGKLVETPYVQEKLEQVLSCLRRNYYVLLHGDTGSGKTELAKLAARVYSREVHGESGVSTAAHEALLLRCYRGMGSEELFGHFALKSAQNTAVSALPDRINDEITEWLSTHQGASQTAIDTATRQITEALLRQTGFTVSEYVLGSVYRAAREGRVVILDEVNFASPDMLVKLNEFLNLSPGDLVHVQEDAIPSFQMHRGFGMICTGNVDYSSSKRYGSGRFEFEPSRLNRLTLIDYDYLPQALKGDYTEVTNPLNKQLFAIALASLDGRDGIASLPDGALEAIWRLCKYARMTQIAFSGQLSRDDENAFQSAGASIEHRPEVLISPRNLVRILKDWSLDAFRYELDHYLYQHFICSTLKPADGALLYQLGRKFGFFQYAWPEGIVDIESLNAIPFRVPDPLNRGPRLSYVHREQMIQAIYGAAPERAREFISVGERTGISDHDRLEIAQVILNFEELVEEVNLFTGQYERDFPVQKGA